MFVFLKTKFVTQVFITRLLPIDLQTCFYVIEVYDNHCAIESKQISINRYLKPMTTLKKRLCLSPFLTFFVNF